MTYKIPIKKSLHYPGFFEELPSLAGKIVAITGTTSGTGYVAALTAAKKGAHVLLLNRSSSRAEANLSALKELCPDSTVEHIPCDLQSFSSVKAAAELLTQRFSQTGLDVLCNNAGVMAISDLATADGFDVQMQTNHLSHFLLTSLLFPLLQKASELKGEARVVNHSSSARSAPPGFMRNRYYEKRGGKLGGDGSSMLFGARWQRYHQSKLANCIFTIEFDKRLKKVGSKVKVMCADPGLAATELQATTAKDGGMGHSFTNMLMNRFSQSAEDGALGILTAMFSPKARSGKLYGPERTFGGRVKETSYGVFVGTQKSGLDLWKLSEDASGVKFEVK